VYASPSFRRSAGPVDMYWLLVVRPVDFGWMWLPMIGCSCRALPGMYGPYLLMRVSLVNTPDLLGC
jgi:hypothetical protein